MRSYDIVHKYKFKLIFPLVQYYIVYDICTITYRFRTATKG